MNQFGFGFGRSRASSNASAGSPLSGVSNPTSGMSSATSVQAKALSAGAGIILNTTLVSAGDQAKFDDSIKGVKIKLDEFKSSPPKNLKEFEDRTKELEGLFAKAQAHIHTRVERSGCDPHLHRAAEKMAFFTLKESFNTEKATIGGKLVNDAMTAIKKELVGLNPNGPLSLFLNNTATCAQKIVDLSKTIDKLGLSTLHTVDSLKADLNRQFEIQCVTLRATDMDITEIAMAAEHVHGLFSANPALSEMTTSGTGSGSESGQARLKGVLAQKFDTKAQVMEGEIQAKLADPSTPGYDPDGARELMTKLNAAVEMVAGPKPVVAQASRKAASPAVVSTLIDIATAKQTQSSAQSHLAKYDLRQELDSCESYLQNGSAIQQEILATPAGAVVALGARIETLTILAKRFDSLFPVDPSGGGAVSGSSSSVGSVASESSAITSTSGSTSQAQTILDLVQLKGLAEERLRSYKAIKGAELVLSTIGSSPAPTLAGVETAISAFTLPGDSAGSLSRSRASSLSSVRDDESTGSASGSLVESTVSSLTIVLRQHTDENSALVRQLTLLKVELQASKKLDDQAAALTNGDHKRQLETLARQLAPLPTAVLVDNDAGATPFSAMPRLPPESAVQGTPRVAESKAKLEEAQHAAAVRTIDFIKNALTLTSEEQVGTFDSPARKNGFKTAISLLTQLKSPQLTSVMTRHVPALTELDALYSGLKTAIGGHSRTTIEAVTVHPGGRSSKDLLVLLKTAKAFCEEFDVSSTDVQLAIQSIVDREDLTLRTPLNNVTLAAGQGPGPLAKAIKDLGVAVRKVADQLDGVPEEKAEVMSRVAARLKTIVEGCTLTFADDTPDARRHSMSDGLAVITALAHISEQLGVEEFPSAAMAQKVSGPLKPIVSAQFKSHSEGVESFVSLDDFETREQEFQITASILSGPHLGDCRIVSSFLSEIGFPQVEGDVRRAISEAKREFVKNEIRTAASSEGPLDMALMERYAKIVGHDDSQSVGTLVGSEPQSQIAGLLGVDARNSSKVDNLINQLKIPGSAVAIASQLSSLTSGEQNPRAEAAVARFATAFMENATLTREERFEIGKALLKSPVISSPTKAAVSKHLVEVMSVHFRVEMGAATDGGLVPQVRSLVTQFMEIQALGLPEVDRASFESAAWSIAKDHLAIPDPIVLKEHLASGKILSMLMRNRTPDVIIDGSITTFVAKVATAQSEALAGQFNMQGDMSTVQSSVEYGAKLAGLRAQLMGDPHPSADGLFSKVRVACNNRLGLLPITDHGKALENLFDVKCLMDQFPIEDVSVALTEKINGFLAYLESNPASASLSIEHLDMFRQLTQMRGVDQAKCEQVRTKLVSSWGDDFSARAKTASATYSSGGPNTFDSSGAKAHLDEWNRFATLFPAEITNSTVTGIKPTIGFFKIHANSAAILDAITLSSKVLDRAGVKVVAEVLETDDNMGPGNSEIPADKKKKMQDAVGVYFKAPTTGTPSPLDTLVAKHKTELSRSVITSGSWQATRLSAAITDLAELATLAELCDRVVPHDGVPSPMGKAIVKISDEIGNLTSTYGTTKSMAALGTKTQNVIEHVKVVHQRTANRVLAAFAEKGEFTKASVNGLMQAIDTSVLDAMKPAIETQMAATIAKQTPTDATSFTQLVEAIGAARLGIGLGQTPKIDRATTQVFTVQVAAYFDGIAITKSNIQATDATELTDIRREFDTLDALVATVPGGQTPSPIATLVTTTKAAKLERLNVAELLHHVHVTHEANRMKDLAIHLRGYSRPADLAKSESFLYSVATNANIPPGAGEGPLNVTIGAAALAADPDEHTLAVMTQVLRSSEGLQVGTLSVDELNTRLTRYVTDGGALREMTGPQMATALAKINTFLTTVGDGEAVQKLPDAVKGKILELVHGALLAAETGGSITAADGAWEGCRPQIDALKGNLGITAARQFGELTNDRVTQFSESILTADQRTTRDEIVGLDHVEQAPGNAANISSQIMALRGRLNTQDNFTGVQKAQLKAVIAAALPKLQIDPDADLQVQANTIGAALTGLNSAAADVQPDDLAILTTDVVRKFDVAQQTRIAAVTFDGDDITSQDGASLVAKKQIVEGFSLADVGGVLVLKDLGTAGIDQKLDNIDKAQVLNIIHLSEQLSEFATATQEHVDAAPALLARLREATQGRGEVTETVGAIRTSLGLGPSDDHRLLQDAVGSENEKLGGLVALGTTLRNIEAGIGNAEVIPSAQRTANLVKAALRASAEPALAGGVDSANLATLAHLLRSTEGFEIRCAGGPLTVQKFGEKLTNLIDAEGNTTAKLTALTGLNTAIGDKLGELPGAVKAKLSDQASAILDEVILQQDPANLPLVGTLGAQLETLGAGPALTSKVANAKLATWDVPAHDGSADWLTTQIANINEAYSNVTGGQTLKPGLAVKVNAAIDAHVGTPPDNGKVSALLTQAQALPPDNTSSNLRIEVLKHLNTRAMAGILNHDAPPTVRADIIKNLTLVGGVTGAQIMANLAAIATAAVEWPVDEHTLGIMAHVLRLSGDIPITDADSAAILTTTIFKDKLVGFGTGLANGFTNVERMNNFTALYVNGVVPVSAGVKDLVKTEHGAAFIRNIAEQTNPGNAREALGLLSSRVDDVTIPATAGYSLQQMFINIEVPDVPQGGGGDWLAKQVADLESACATLETIAPQGLMGMDAVLLGKITEKVNVYVDNEGHPDPVRMAELNASVVGATPKSGLQGTVGACLRELNVAVANAELTTLEGLATFEFKYGVALADVRDRLVQIARDASAGDSVDELLMLAHVMRISGSTPISIDGAELTPASFATTRDAFLNRETTSAGIRTLLIGADGNGGLLARLDEFPDTEKGLLQKAAGAALRAVVLEPGSLQPNADALGEVVSKFAARGVNVSGLQTALIAKFEVELTSQINRAQVIDEHFTGDIAELTQMRAYVNDEAVVLTDVGDTRFSTAGAAARTEKLGEIDAAIELHGVLDNIPIPPGPGASNGRALMRLMENAPTIPAEKVSDPRVQAKLQAILDASKEWGDTPVSFATQAHVFRLTAAADV